VAYLVDDNSIIFDIKQNPVIPHAKTITEVSLAQPFDVASQAAFQARYLSYYLRRYSFWERTQVVDSRGCVLDLKSSGTHANKFISKEPALASLRSQH
jgi:hypothetical protein